MKEKYSRHASLWILVGFCLCLAAFVSLRTNHFLSLKNLVNILEATSYRLILAVGMTFIIGSFLAAVGSTLYFTNYASVTPTSGAMPGLKAFVAAVFGGIGSIPGAVVGAFIIGICENIIKGMKLTVCSNAFTFVLLIVILMVKPTGLFGEKNIDKV